jgi:hypothetical protein
MNIMNKSGRFNIDLGCYIKNVGEAFTRLLKSSYSRSLMRDSRRGTTTTRKSELSFCSW